MPAFLLMRVPRQSQHAEEEKKQEEEEEDEDDNSHLIDNEEDELETRSISTLPRENGSGSSAFKDRINREQPSYIGKYSNKTICML